MKKTLPVVVCLISLTLMLSACGDQPSPSAVIQPAQTSSESFVVAGDYELHYNALRTDQLTADIARAYGIERSKNKVLLNVSVLQKNAGAASTAIDATVSVVARNLNGQIKDAPLRRIAESNAIYYIGEVSFSGAETMVFEITATPAGSSIPIAATMTREFFAD